MGKEAQLVSVRSSFSKRFGIVSTRELEPYWLYPKAFTRIKELSGDLGSVSDPAKWVLSVPGFLKVFI